MLEAFAAADFEPSVFVVTPNFGSSSRRDLPFEYAFQVNGLESRVGYHGAGFRRSALNSSIAADLR